MRSERESDSEGARSEHRRSASPEDLLALGDKRGNESEGALDVPAESSVYYESGDDHQRLGVGEEEDDEDMEDDDDYEDEEDDEEEEDEEEMDWDEDQGKKPSKAKKPKVRVPSVRHLLAFTLFSFLPSPLPHVGVPHLHIVPPPSSPRSRRSARPRRARDSAKV